MFFPTPRHRSDKPNVVMMSKEGSTKIVNFMTPGQGFCARAWPYKSYSENALLLENIFLPTLPGMVQTNKIFSNDDQGRFYQIRKFHISHYSEYVLSILLYQYTSH